MVTSQWVMFVSPPSSGDGWAIQWEGGREEENTHDTLVEAVAAAKALVGGLPAGSCSQIVVQGQDGQFRTEWTYGADPFPPEGWSEKWAGPE